VAQSSYGAGFAQPAANDGAAVAIHATGSPEEAAAPGASAGGVLALGAVRFAPQPAAGGSSSATASLQILLSDTIPGRATRLAVEFGSPEFSTASFDRLDFSASFPATSAPPVIERSFTTIAAALAFFDEATYALLAPNGASGDLLLDLRFGFVASRPDTSFALGFVVAVPEPSSAASLALGLLLLVWGRRLRRTG
jgi:hypothetical protein